MIPGLMLNLGCGRLPLRGYVNVDRWANPGVDMVFDLEVTPYPFETACADHILASHVLEHLHEPFKIVGEWIRILKPGGLLEILVPYWKWPGARHLEHRQYFDEDSFYIFITGGGDTLDQRRLLDPVKIHLHHVSPIPLAPIRKALGRTYGRPDIARIESRCPRLGKLPLGPAYEVHYLFRKLGNDNPVGPRTLAPLG